MMRIYSLFFLLFTAVEASANETGCEYIFSTIRNIKIENCDKNKIRATSIHHEEKIRIEGAVFSAESNAYTGYDLKINNSFIEPANTGRYITHIDSKYELITKQGKLQVIHSDAIFGDGQSDKSNTYYACFQPEFKKCLMLGVEGWVRRGDVNKMLTKMAEREW